MPTDITVRGSFTAFEPPERGTVQATVAAEGPAMQPVYDRVARDLEAVKTSLTPLHDAEQGPVTWWSAEALRTWSNRPWNQDGKQLPLVHHARVGVEAKFLDFSELSRWVGGHIAATDGFRVDNVEWTLTTRRRDELLKHVRTEAVRDAVERARQYADALGLGEIHPVAIADAGMLGAKPDSGPGPGPGVARFAVARSARAPEVEFVPADIEVSVEVDARFAAG